jgi:hypothetical protein
VAAELIDPVRPIVALLSIRAYPFWSLAIFAVDLAIVYCLAVYGGQGRTGLESRFGPSAKRMLTSLPYTCVSPR